jgi:23S rRNA (pseudouridine1915-N3)-methyltransferase
MDSPELARYLESLALRSVPEVSFVVGGAFGLGPGVVKRANRTLALSAGTLPHELARLVLAEQLYRAGTILRNEPYHKGGT